MSRYLCPYMGQIIETGPYVIQPPHPHFNVGGVVREKLGKGFGYRFRNNLEMGGQGAEGGFHNDALVVEKQGLSRLFVPGTDSAQTDFLEVMWRHLGRSCHQQKQE